MYPCLDVKGSKSSECPRKCGLPPLHVSGPSLPSSFLLSPSLVIKVPTSTIHMHVRRHMPSDGVAASLSDGHPLLPYTPFCHGFQSELSTSHSIKASLKASFKARNVHRSLRRCCRSIGKLHSVTPPPQVELVRCRRRDPTLEYLNEPAQSLRTLIRTEKL